jgi:hypothetical protein
VGGQDPVLRKPWPQCCSPSNAWQLSSASLIEQCGLDLSVASPPSLNDARAVFLSVESIYAAAGRWPDSCALKRSSQQDFDSCERLRWDSLEAKSGPFSLLFDNDFETATSPSYPSADVEGMVVVAASNRAVVTEVNRGCLGDGGAGREADGRRVEGRRDRPAGIGVVMHPGQTKRQIERFGVAQPDRAGEFRAERAAQRCGGLLRHANRSERGRAERDAARAGERADSEGYMAVKGIIPSVAEDDAQLVRRLGFAVAAVWTDLSAASQTLILEQAAAVGDAQETTQLREQLQTFIRERLSN